MGGHTDVGNFSPFDKTSTPIGAAAQKGRFFVGPSGLAGWPRGGERTDGWTNTRTYGRNISPFYRTLFPIGAAALPPPMKTKEKVEQGKGTADHLMPLGYLFR